MKISAMIGYVIGFILVAPLVSVFLGALAGYIVSLVFKAPLLAVMANIGLSGITLPQLGAFLGFVTYFIPKNSAVANKILTEF